MNEITTKRDPAVLALEIRTLQQQAESILTRYIIEIGRRLCEAKAVLDHGQWGPWLKEQVQFSQSTAQNYMKIYERFGSDQASLFGEAKSETVANLPYTKALKLLALPDDEVEEFIEENNVADMSTRELAKAIRERDEAKKALSAEQNARLLVAGQVYQLKDEVAAAQSKAAEAGAEANRLRVELQELRSRPVEVAVQEPSPELLEQIRAEEARKAAVATEALEKKLAAAEAKATKEAEKAKKLKDKVDKAGEEAKAAMQKDMDAAAAAQREAEAAKADAEARAKALEDKLKTADSEAAVFKVYYQRVQEDLNRMLGMIQKADPAQKAKYKAAIRALLDSVGGMLA